MKIKSLYILFIVVVIILAGWILHAYDQAKILNSQLIANGLIPNHLSVRGRSTSLSGQSLVLYDITHSDYPNLKIKRGQFQNTEDTFTISLKNIQGDLFQYLQQTQILFFKKDLDQYNPASDLLKFPFITLAILGEHDLNLDISLEGIKTAPNQIALELVIYKDNQQKIRFSTKLTPKYANAPLFDNLRAQKLSMRLSQICSEWKQILDDYSLSKNKPFIQENGPYEFSFSETK